MSLALGQSSHSWGKVGRRMGKDGERDLCVLIFRPISCTSASGDAGTGESPICDMAGSLEGMSLILL